jgi:hypothetical protein
MKQKVEISVASSRCSIPYLATGSFRAVRCRPWCSVFVYLELHGAGDGVYFRVVIFIKRRVGCACGWGVWRAGGRWFGGGQGVG